MRHRLLTILAIVLALPGLARALTITGTVQDPSGAPVAGATVTATAGGSSATAVTGAEGRFTLELAGAERGPITLQVAAEGFQTATLELRAATAPVEVVLSPAAVFSDQVEVTANRARAGETPVTLSNVTREEIERGYWGQDVPVFLSQVPGFYAYNDNGNDIGYSYFTLRGFDMRRTAVELNGVPLNDAESHGVFFIDLADFLSTTGDIQVQRGVGTHLYGGAAIGGSVDLQTRRPLLEPRLRIATLHGSWDTTRFNVEYDTGLSRDGRWAATFRWSRVDTDGYRDQSWVEMWNYFGTIERYGDRSTLRLVLFGGPEDTHLAYAGVPRAYLDGEITGDRRRDRRFNPLTYPGQIDHFFQPHEQLIHTWQVSDNLVLENTLFYFQGDGYFKQFKADRWMPEYGLTPFTGPDGELIDTTDLVRKRTVEEWDAGWIPHLQWTHAGGRGRLQAGAALRLHQAHHYGQVVWAEHTPPGLEPDHRYYDYEVGKRTVQPFLQESYRLSDRWNLMAGLTWTSHRYELKKDRRKGIAFDESYDFLLPRLGITYKPTQHLSLFANVSRGAREPAFRDIYDPQDYWSERVHLDEEKLTDYELGVQQNFLRGYLRANLYWLHFSNEIVWAGALDDSGVPITANGAVTNHRGVELEGAWNPADRWGAHLALSWSRNTFSRFTEFDWDGNPVDHSGNRIAGVPDWLATLQLTGGWGPVDGLLTLRHVGRFYLDNTEDMRKFPEARSDPGYIHRVNDAFTVVDLALRVDLGTEIADMLSARAARIDLRINNLTDELYTTFGYMDWPEPVWTPAATRSVYAGLTVDW
jgi:iron complex outermembrane receptor protein